MLPVAVQVPVVGSYTSAVAQAPPPLPPPVTRTLPLGSSVAVCPLRALAMLPLAVQPPVGRPACGAPGAASVTRPPCSDSTHAPSPGSRVVVAWYWDDPDSN